MVVISLEALGFNETFKTYSQENGLETFLPARVVLAHRERYIVWTETGEMEAELLGNLRYTAESKADFPVVGDWVAVSPYDQGKALIHAVYPRHTLLERKAVGKTGEKQLIASNIDVGWVVQSLNRDFNLNRLERYVTLCHSAGIVPMILLSKIDLVEESLLSEVLEAVHARFRDLIVIPFSNASEKGIDLVEATIEPAKTYCLLGSSGVGKSSLINSLSGQPLMETGAISESIDRGKHVTTHRELIRLDSGALLIDNPGMREVGLADSSDGLAVTFEEIHALAEDCKFKDCTHTNEDGCAVLAALNSGELEEATYEHFMRLEREEAHYASTVHERRQKDKQFGKMVKGIMKQKKRNKF